MRDRTAAAHGPAPQVISRAAGFSACGAATHGQPPREQVVDRAAARSAPASSKRSRNRSKTSGCSRGRRLRSPPRSSGRSPAKSVASSAARSSSAGPRPVEFTERCMQATARGLPRGSVTCGRSSVRRSGHLASRTRRSDLDRPGRTHQQHVRAALVGGDQIGVEVGQQRAAANRARGGRSAPEPPAARHRSPQRPSQRGGASCSSATSHSMASSTRANSSCSGRLTCTCVAFRSVLRAAGATGRVNSAGSGGWSRPWNRFQVTAVHVSDRPGRCRPVSRMRR